MYGYDDSYSSLTPTGGYTQTGFVSQFTITATSASTGEVIAIYRGDPFIESRIPLSLEEDVAPFVYIEPDPWRVHCVVHEFLAPLSTAPIAERRAPKIRRAARGRRPLRGRSGRPRRRRR